MIARPRLDVCIFSNWTAEYNVEAPQFLSAVWDDGDSTGQTGQSIHWTQWGSGYQGQ